MKIAFFSKHLPSDQPSGVSVQVDRLASALVALGHDVTCFSFSPCPQSARYRCEHLNWGSASRLMRKFLPALMFRSVNISRFDIVHFHGDDYLCHGSPRRVRTFYGSALSEAVHAGKPGRFFYQALFYAFEWFSCFRRGTLAGISEATRKALPRISHVIPCGVPLDRFCPDDTKKTNHPSILFIGDFKSRKQGDLLLRAFRQSVLPVFPNAELTVVGPESIAAPNVRCIGRIAEPDLIGEYRRSWIYCMPSSYEGFGVPLIEAFACGTAVVALKNPGTVDIIDPFENGILCTAATLGESLTNLIGDAGLRARLIAGGRAKAEEYDMVKIAQRYLVVYEERGRL